MGQPIECIHIKGTTSKAVVLFHGYGASMDDLAPLHQWLDPAGKYHWYFPNGPVRIPFGDQWEGRAWFPIDMAELERAMRAGGHRDFSGLSSPDFKAAVEVMEEFIKSLESQHPEIVVGGFSQGAILSYGVALSNPKKIKNVIGLSGYVSEPILKQGFENNDFSTLGIFASHGTVDQIIPIEWARKSDNFLTQTNITHTYKEYPIGHGISPQVFFDFKNWLQAHS
jgi:phospholipase/carboxylesterase